jgi:RNA-binding protein
MALTAKQRQQLKGLAHNLSPVVRVGRGGVSEAVIKETASSLGAHELIKVRIDSDESSARKELADELATATESAVVVVIGKTAILYKERAEKPEIKLK